MGRMPKQTTNFANAFASEAFREPENTERIPLQVSHGSVRRVHFGKKVLPSPFACPGTSGGPSRDPLMRP